MNVTTVRIGQEQRASEDRYDPPHYSDQDLDNFIQGKFEEPEERVSREGVPDYRPGERQAPKGSYSWQNESFTNRILKRASMQVKLKKFGYFPVSGDQIRLLRVRPGKPTDPLECDLATKSLSEVQGKYEALSYCWGKDQPEHIIKIQKLETYKKPTESGFRTIYWKPKEFPVRTNLYDALHVLRSETRTVVLWVDAICIDQNDTPDATREKEQQLSMMDRIYNSAKNVCIWLGDASESSKDAFSFIREITDFRTFDIILDARKQEETKVRWCNLIDSLKASWFGRRWIIQEVASARQASVHFGQDIVHWDDLADAISLLNEKAEDLKTSYRDPLFEHIPTLSASHLVKAIGNVCRKSQDGEVVERLLDLETLVSTFQQFQATFPEDIIHSIRSLAKDAPSQDEGDFFRTTVEQKKSTRDLFVAFVSRCISRSKSLDIICRHWAPPPTDTAGEAIKLPSWVSDLSKSPFGLPGRSHGRENGENFVAMSPTDSRKRYSASGVLNAYYAANLPRHSGGSLLVARTAPEISIFPAHSPPDQTTITGQNLLLSPAPLEGPDPFAEATKGSGLGRRGGFLEPKEASPKPNVSSDVLTNGTRPRAVSNPQPPPSLEPIPETLENARPVTPRRFSSTEHNLDKRVMATTPAQSSSRPLTINTANTQPGLVDNQGEMKSPGTPSNTSATRKHSRRGSTQVEQRRYTQEDDEHNSTLPGMLQVQGFILGTIKRRSDLMRRGIVPGDWLQILGWDRDSKENRVPEIIWRMLVADRTPDGGKPPGWYQRACLHSLRDTRVTSSRGDLCSGHADKTSEMTSKFLKRVESVVWDRRIFEMTSSWYPDGDSLFGLAPDSTEDGDVVCILFGCSVPVALRKVEGYAGGKDVYELLGEAYVHGKMDGEAVHDMTLVNQFRTSFYLV